MRVMVIVPASKESEAGVLPDTKILAEMGKFNEELVKAGVLLAAEGLQPTAKGKRVKFSGGTPAVIDGFSDLIRELWGEAGRHARSAIGAAELPFDIPVEVEAAVELE